MRWDVAGLAVRFPCSYKVYATGVVLPLLGGSAAAVGWCWPSLFVCVAGSKTYGAIAQARVTVKVAFVVALALAVAGAMSYRYRYRYR